jgi:hypothetical protein
MADVARWDQVSRISLRLRHPVRDVGVLLENWGFEVGRSWNGGKPRTTPRGDPLAGVWPHSYAYTRLGVHGATLAECLDRGLEMVEPFSAELTEFVDAGGNAELFVGWHFERNSGDIIGWEMLQRLSRCKLALSLDVYPEVEPEMKEMTDGQT